MSELARRVVEHYRANARELPFRKTRDPYAIWVCEVMAQQTRLQVVIPYWQRWMARFPTPRALAEAPLDDVLAAWAGLGYYARARSLHAAARVIVDRHGGELPRELEQIRALPGIGPYTAGAIASIAFGQRAAIVDGNVARILARVHGIEDDVRAPGTRDRLWELAAALVPDGAASEFNQGLMDIGATICTPRNPACLACPLAAGCVARATGRQGELPVLARRAATRAVAVRVALVVRPGPTGADARWLLMRRAPRGLFGGLWELPDAAALPVTLARRPLAEHVHQLSHRTIHYRVYPARLRGPARPRAPYDRARYVTPGQLASLAASSATAALARKLTEQGPWPTQTARRRSSAKASARSSTGSRS